VTKGLQRAFSDSSGHVVLIDKLLQPRRQRARRVSVTNTFVKRNFSSHLEDGHYIDDTEDKWSGVENEAIPPIRAWIDGVPTASGWDPVGSREATKMMAALHFARSFAFKDRHEVIADEQRRKMLASLPGDATFQRMWREAYGAPPSARDIAALVNEGWDERFGPNSVFAMEQMARYYNLALDYIGPLHVQALRTIASAEFILGDCALVVARSDGTAIGARRLALRDADRLFLPLSPRLGVMFTSHDEGDVDIGDAYVQSLNRFTWEASGSHVIAHPASDLGHSLERTGWMPKVGRNLPCPCGSGRKAKRCHQA
jgi:hypothetical protein